MVQCPNCSHQIDQEFGMVTCPECQAVFMIDFSGNVEFSDGKTALSEPIPMEEDGIEDPIVPQEEPSFVAEAEPQDDFLENENSFETTEPENYLEEPVGEDLPEDEYVPVEEHESFPVSAEDGNEVEPLEEESAFEESFAEEPVMAAPIAVPDNQPVDITDFANSEESLLEEGQYLYDLTIDRIDSKELRETVKYVLGDDKLKLDLNEVMSHLKNGCLLVQDLHPLKAKRIIEQLQYFDFDISWKQRLVVLEDEMVEMPEMDAEADVDL